MVTYPSSPFSASSTLMNSMNTNELSLCCLVLMTISLISPYFENYLWRSSRRSSSFC